MKELSFIEKELLLEIDSLDCTPDHCFASNSYFAEFFNCGTATITRGISKLKKLKLIQVLSKNSTKRIIKSDLKIYSLAHCSDQNDEALSSNQNDQHNNISINNTSNKEKEVKEKENNGGRITQQGRNGETKVSVHRVGLVGTSIHLFLRFSWIF